MKAERVMLYLSETLLRGDKPSQAEYHCEMLCAMKENPVAPEDLEVFQLGHLTNRTRLNAEH